MKKIYFIIAASLLWTAAFSQSFMPNPILLNQGDLKFNKPLSVPQRHLSPSPLSNYTITIDYDDADAYAWGIPASSFIWDMNIHPANSATLQYCTVAFDSLYDTNNYLGYADGNVASVTLDTIYAFVGQQNKSGIDDTLRVKVVAVDANGYPTTTVLWTNDKIIPHASPLSGTNNNWVYSSMVTWAPNYIIAGSAKKFAVRLEYYGAKADTLGFLAAFSPIQTPCSNPNVFPPLADSTNFSRVYCPTCAPSYSLVANSFAYWTKFSQQLPGPTGVDVYYDCNNDGKDDYGDGKNYIQNIDIFAQVTLNNVTGVNDYSSMGLSLLGTYPNPAHDFTNIRYRLDESTNVSIEVRDLIGRVIKQASSEKLSAGIHETKISLKDFSSGNYFYTITTGKSHLAGKFIVAK